MIKSALLVVAFAAAALAQSVQTDGDVTVQTQGTPAVGLPGVVDFMAGTYVWINSTDASVTQFQVIVTSQSDDGAQRTVSQITPKEPGSYSSLVYLVGVAVADVTAVQVIEIPTGASHTFREQPVAAHKAKANDRN